MNNTLQGIIFLVIGFVVILGITVLIISKMPNQVQWESQQQLNYDKCCNGNPCTDTFYSTEDNKCHSTFEWQLPTKWYILLPIVCGVALAITLIIKFIPIPEEAGK